MHETTRPITEDEKRQLLQRYTLTNPGCFSRFAYLGMFLILLPAVLAGAAAQLLRRFLGLDAAFISGIAIGIAASVALYAIKERRERRLTRLVAEKRARAEGITTVTVYELTIEGGWEIDEEDLHCFLLDAGDVYVFLATPLELPETFPSRTLRLVVAEENSVVLQVALSGEPVPLKDKDLDSPEIEPWLDALEEVRFLPASELPRSWQSAVAVPLVREV